MMIGITFLHEISYLEKDITKYLDLLHKALHEQCDEVEKCNILHELYLKDPEEINNK